MDLKVMLDAVGVVARDTRSSYHLTLGEAIAALAPADQTIPVMVDTGGSVGSVGSYRGYYADLAFEPQEQPSSVSAVLTDLQVALGLDFEGYKGGDFVMQENTPLWVASYGDASGIAVIGLSVSETAVTLLTKKID